MIEITCPICGLTALKHAGSVNRSRAAGAPLYCSRECASIGRRKPPKTADQKKAEKSAYDAKRRNEKREEIKRKKAEYHKRTYDKDKAAAYRKENMARHVAYCQAPEYKAYKKTYDREYRAKKFYGDMWESFLLAMDIHDAAVRAAGGQYELLLAKGVLGKSQKRRRDYDRLDREGPEAGALGNLEFGERW